MLFLLLGQQPEMMQWIKFCFTLFHFLARVSIEHFVLGLDQESTEVKKEAVPTELKKLS